MIEDLKTLYAVFDLLNNKEISVSPSMSNPEKTHYIRFLSPLLKWINGGIPVNKWTLVKMQEELTAVNHCYYQTSELREPIRINNCPYIQILDKLLEELDNNE